MSDTSKLEQGRVTARRKLAKASMCGLLAGATILAASTSTLAATSYSYDLLGRLTTVLYDSGLCIAYTYDANGNRTAITTVSTTPQTPTWGAATWGCFPWTP